MQINTLWTKHGEMFYHIAALSTRCKDKYRLQTHKIQAQKPAVIETEAVCKTLQAYKTQKKLGQILHCAKIMSY